MSLSTSQPLHPTSASTSSRPSSLMDSSLATYALSLSRRGDKTTPLQRNGQYSRKMVSTGSSSLQRTHRNTLSSDTKRGAVYARYKPNKSYYQHNLSQRPVSNSKPDSTVQSLYKTASRATEVAKTLQETLRERGREQNALHSSVLEQESRVALLQATVQRLEAEGARTTSQRDVLKSKLEQAEVRAEEARSARTAAEEQAERNRKLVAEAQQKAARDLENAAATMNGLQDQLAAERADAAAKSAALLRLREEVATAYQELEEERRLRRDEADKSDAARVDQVRQHARRDLSAVEKLENEDAAASIHTNRLILDQQVQELRRKDEVIMAQRDRLDELEAVEAQRQELQLQLEMTQRGLNNAIDGRVDVDGRLVESLKERDDLIETLRQAQVALRLTQSNLLALRTQADGLDSKVASLESSVEQAQQATRMQLDARLAAEQHVANVRAQLEETKDALALEFQNGETLQYQNDNMSNALAQATVEANKLRIQASSASKVASSTRDELVAAQRNLEDRERALQEAEAQMMALSRARAQAEEDDLAKGKTVAYLEDLLHRVQERFTTEQERSSRLQTDLDETRESLRRHEQELHSVRTEAATATAAASETDSAFNALRERADLLDRQLSEKYNELARLTVTANRDAEDKTRLQAECDRLRGELQQRSSVEHALVEGIRAATNTTRGVLGRPPIY